MVNIQIYTSIVHTDTLTTSDELENALKLMKNRKIPGEGIINSELYKCSPEGFKMSLLKFLNNINPTTAFEMNGEMPFVITLFKKGDTRNPETYIRISMLNTCYKMFSKIFNIHNCRETQNSL
jgi:hypothetical protein